jgi:hypothetical protein
MEKFLSKGLIIVLISLPIILFLFFLRPFFTPVKRVDVLKEISELNPTETTINFITRANCSSISKYSNYWLVDKCKDDVYFKLFLKNGSYYLGICTNWSSPREAVLKLKDYIGGCVDLNVEDKDVTSAGMKRAGLKMYSVCGRDIVFKDECIVSWWRSAT